MPTAQLRTSINPGGNSSRIRNLKEERIMRKLSKSVNRNEIRIENEDESP
jgi:hypothetical protein